MAIPVRLAQITSLWLGMSLMVALETAADQQPIFTNAIQRVVQTQASSATGHFKPLKKVFLSDRAVTCNDGSQAGFYLRKSSNSKKWIIFLEGGWYCYDYNSCRNRWIKQRHYMTSSKWPETKDVGGILSPDIKENPYWWSANHVFVPYCSSDSWSGSKRSEKQSTFSYMGSSIVLQVVRDLIPLGLENSTDLLLAGSSAGGTGVMLNLDFVDELLHDEMQLKQVKVKGVTDSGWFLDRTPYVPTIKTAVDAVRKGMDLWMGRVPRRCREQYSDEPWRCYFGYRIYPTLKAKLFVFQWLFDEAQMDADNVGAPVTKQQWDYIHKMGDALRHSFQNVTAVFAPSCISHSVLTKRDWQEVKIDDMSIADALHCWERKDNRKINKRKNYKNKRQSDRNRVIDTGEVAGRNLTSGVADDAKRRLRNKPGLRRKRKGKGKKRQPYRNHAANAILSNDLIARPNVLKRRRSNGRRCAHRRLEKCSWPQCNHSCPKLHDPYTGEEMDFIELLKSFGLDMESVASALGIDMDTLNNMDQAELLNMLTQHSS
ncbi:palmitoleoyl-protein carboxylesterase NOTUM [Cylas formicarius]|uniref:palmitoleoyl-protein carboxylesterase NOTUM n=1 Tax=Cylas formicarius TaxID=197179 RepID=UPI0029588100|nr:palmitoleoyl-protein carboxylesterase NOTUM [Cylas formicarius]